MERFDYNKISIAEAITFLKENNDVFYKNINAWDLLTKHETEFVSNLEILEHANLLYNNLNK